MPTLIDRIGKTYDEVPYVSSAYHASAPEHLHAVTHLFGLDAPPPAHARVLELGCAAGGNLIPFAVRHPDAHCVGVDLSPVQIEAGRQAVETMGLRNVRLVQGSLSELGAELGTFDYIVCHGVYSWVPDEVRAAILRVCAQRLSPGGVAYVSYNTYPGWKAKEIVRDAMLLRGAERATAAERLAYARGMIEFLHEQATQGSVLSSIMNEHIDMIRSGKDYYLSHEYMELCNAPCYFRDFVAASRQHGLEYLGDATVATMFASNHGAAPATALLNECGGDQVLLEQLMDFLGNRTFRQTLLVHGSRSAGIRYQLDEARLRSLHVAGWYAPKEAGEGASEEWTHPRGGTVRTASPLSRGVIERLNAAWPATVPVAALVDGLAAADATQVLGLVSNLVIGNAVLFQCEPVAPAALSDRPVVRPEVRALAGNPGTTVALFNEWHESMHPGPLEGFLLSRLDGSADRAALVSAVVRAVGEDMLTVTRDGKPLQDADELAAAIPPLVDGALRWLALSSMLAPAQSGAGPTAVEKQVTAKPPKASKPATSSPPGKAPRGRK